MVGTRLSGGRDQAGADALRNLGRGRAGAEADDPVCELAVRDSDAVAVELQERQHRDERNMFVAVEGRLSLGDAVGEFRCLEDDVTCS
jgi:hypothetical protein